MYKTGEIENIVNQWINSNDFFIVDIRCLNSGAIKVEIDSDNGINIDQCIELTNFIHARLDRDKTDYELEVSSPGLGQNFKVLRQYFKNIGKLIETTGKDGKKYKGKLVSATETGFTIETEQKTRIAGKKKSIIEKINKTFKYQDITNTKNIIDFKSLK